VLAPSQQRRVVELQTTIVTDVLSVVSNPPPKAYADMRELAKDMARMRNAFKASTYLYAVTLQVAEKTHKAGGAEGGGGGAGKRGGKKAAPATRKVCCV